MGFTLLDEVLTSFYYNFNISILQTILRFNLLRYGVFHYIRDLILGDDVLLYIAYVMLIWAAPIPATRCHCSLRS